MTFLLGHKLNLGKKRPDMVGNSWNKNKILSQEHKNKIRESMLGKNVKEGSHTEAYRMRRWSAYNDWRVKVFKRDNYTCQSCGFPGNEGYITAHHIKSVSKYPELIFVVDNGITLCELCHSQTDNYKGRGKRRQEWQK